MAKKAREFGGQWIGEAADQSSSSRVDIDVTRQGVEVTESRLRESGQLDR
jgi:hypothetical protein